MNLHTKLELIISKMEMFYCLLSVEFKLTLQLWQQETQDQDYSSMLLFNMLTMKFIWYLEVKQEPKFIKKMSQVMAIQLGN